jgi:hypothetical protein
MGMFMKPTNHAIAVLACAALTGTATAAPAAHAATAAPTPELACPAKVQVHFTPKLNAGGKNAQTSFTIKGSFDSCTPTGSPHAAGGTFEGSGTGKMSCNGGNTQGQGAVHWATGETSDFTMRVVNTPVASQQGKVTKVAAGGAGPITTGPYAGDSFNAGMILEEGKEKCAAGGPGLTNEQGDGKLFILPRT